jgi:hypothetical protein
MPSDRPGAAAAVALSGAALALAARDGAFVLAGLAALAVAATLATGPAAREREGALDALLAAAAVAQVVLLEAVLHAVHGGAANDVAALRARLAVDPAWIGAAGAAAGLQVGAVARLAARTTGARRLLLAGIALASAIPAARLAGPSAAALAGLVAGVAGGAAAAPGLDRLRRSLRAPRLAAPMRPRPLFVAARMDERAARGERLLLRGAASGATLLALLGLLYALAAWRQP